MIWSTSCDESNLANDEYSPYLEQITPFIPQPSNYVVPSKTKSLERF
ncbi:hypothetical protein [Bacillus sp. AFS017336]|nr:hypothetical protein [Bacillus sp. AFS017336]